jgi:hypothetical protein
MTLGRNQAFTSIWVPSPAAAATVAARSWSTSRLKEAAKRLEASGAGAGERAWRTAEVSMGLLTASMDKD